MLSNFVLHELKTGAEREKMSQEIVRVLKPGGRLALIDFIFTGECLEVVWKNGMSSARRSRIGTQLLVQGDSDSGRQSIVSGHRQKKILRHHYKISLSNSKFSAERVWIPT
ncbi:MAG: methyltransferase domain-containing protein [Chloracidobacterium sp.]|nr:methyltransferase domain-containing protein [Chloracidobacterium sp.]